MSESTDNLARLYELYWPYSRDDLLAAARSLEWLLSRSRSDDLRLEQNVVSSLLDAMTIDP